MKLRLVHVVIDDKFIDGAIDLFNSDDRVDNTFVITGLKRELKYIKSPLVKFVEEKELIGFINKFDVVVLHSLPSVPIRFVEDINNEVKVVWLAWGYDIYEKPYDIIPVKLFGPATKNFYRRMQLKELFYWEKLKNNFFVKKHLASALKRIDYFSGVFPYEINLMRSSCKMFRAEAVDFYYGSTNFFVPEKPSMEISHGKKNIIINNSGNVTGNHLDVLKAISHLRFDEDSKIIIPLSYGADPSYAEIVEKTADVIAPGRVMSLNSYMPLDDYLKLISSCKTAVFAHERQQASDNILMQLLYGARVFMSETSEAYKYLKSIGLKVYSLSKDINLFLEEMEDDDVMTNRKILSSLYSSSKLIERVLIIDDILTKSKGLN